MDGLEQFYRDVLVIDTARMYGEMDAYEMCWAVTRAIHRYHDWCNSHPSRGAPRQDVP